MEYILDILIRLLFGPFMWWKNNNEESSLGQTEFNKSTVRFWKWFAILGFLLVTAIVGLLLFSVL
jgi:hypothetical protein